jgi:hypothetical protein
MLVSHFISSLVIFFTFSGGTTALLATMILGPRRGRFYDAQGEPLDTPKPFPGHSVALQLLGTMVLWFGCKFTTCSIDLLFAIMLHPEAEHRIVSILHIKQGLVSILDPHLYLGLNKLEKWQQQQLLVQLLLVPLGVFPHYLQICTWRREQLENPTFPW